MGFFSVIIKKYILSTRFCIKCVRKALTTGLLLWVCVVIVQAQHAPILQAYYWDVPVDDQHKNGSWYDTISARIPFLQEIGIKYIWLPPPSKGNWGIFDSGYGIYDHYDLGEYEQIGSVETRYGSKKELQNLVRKSKQYGIKVIADIVLNHMYSSQPGDLEYNPVLENYQPINQNYKKEKTSYYPTNEVVWELRCSSPGEYLIKIVSDEKSAKDWDGSINITLLSSLVENIETLPEPIEENSAENSQKLETDHVYISPFFPKGNSRYFKIRTTKPHETLFIKLALGYYVGQKFHWANQENYISIQSETKQLKLRPLTYTAIKPKSKLNEIDGAWNYQSFHPSSANDFLKQMIDNCLTPNAKIFGHDFDHRNSTVQKRLINWGQWLIDSIGYEGVRLDFVQGIDIDYISRWIKEVLHQRDDNFFLVGEYFSFNKTQIKSWNNFVVLNSGKKDVKSFDFPLKQELTKMCNNFGNYDMRNLIHAGMLLDPEQKLEADNLVSFVENHDTGKENDKWVKQHWDMAYAFVMMAPPQVCVYYNHLFPTPYVVMDNHENIQQIPGTLPGKIIRLLEIRKKYVHQNYRVLSDTCKKFKNIFVSMVESKDGSPAFLILNNSGSDQNLKIKLPDGILARHNSAKFVDLFNKANYTSVLRNGVLELNIMPYTVSILVEEKI